MTLPNGIQFLGDVTNAYRSLEAKVCIKAFQDSIPPKFAHLISTVSFLAIGYFNHLNTNNTLLGTSLAARVLVSHAKPTSGEGSSLYKGVLLPMSRGSPKDLFGRSTPMKTVWGPNWVFHGKCFVPHH